MKKQIVIAIDVLSPGYRVSNSVTPKAYMEFAEYMQARAYALGFKAACLKLSTIRPVYIIYPSRYDGQK